MKLSAEQEKKIKDVLKSLWVSGKDTGTAVYRLSDKKIETFHKNESIAAFKEIKKILGG